MFAMYEMLFFVMFFSVIALMIYQVGSEGLKVRENNNSPRLIIDAKVVSKRSEDIRRRHKTANGGSYHTNRTSYYVTFQVESGDRMELMVEGSEYGLLVEGDYGKLMSQGTRFLNFTREM